MVADPSSLAPTYYLDNFECMLAGVQARYDDLLLQRERDFLDGFRALSRGARCVWVRLLSRKGPVFRRDRISYPETGDVAASIGELIDRGFVDEAADAEVATLLSLLLRSEIDELARELGAAIGPHPTKTDGVAALLATVPDELLAQAARYRTEFVRLRHQHDTTVFRLLYFGNLRQHWTEFVLTDLQIWRYEDYPMRPELRRFDSRGAIDDVLEIAAMRTGVGKLLADGKLAEASDRIYEHATRPEGWHGTSRRTLASLLCEVGTKLERAGELHRALELYGKAMYPPARERRARVLARLDRPYEAIALCREIAADPLDEEERLFAPRFLHVLQRRLGQVAALHRARRPRKLLRVARDDARSVEALALEALEDDGSVGFHAENWLWRSLFGLCFWDIVFHPAPGAFEHPFQTGPLDLWSPDFRSLRAELVQGRLDEVRGGAWSADRVGEVWAQKVGIRNALVRWDPPAHDAVIAAARAVPGKDLAHIFDRLSRDLRRYRRGLPDLFVVSNDHTSYQLLEVKGPGDQLRPEQRGWLDYLATGGISAHVLAVEWTPRRARRQRH